MPQHEADYREKSSLGDTMMAAKPSGRRRWLPVVIAMIVGLLAGIGIANAYPPPSTDMLKVQAEQWYQSMRNLVSPADHTGMRPWVGDPQIYGVPPVAPPPAADTTKQLVADDVAALLNVNAPMPNADQLAGALNATAQELSLRHRMVVVDAATGQTLYDRGGTEPVVPASTLKLFTAVAVLQHLDLGHRFTTSASYTPDDGVTLIGGGDGLLALGEGTGETVGHAGLADLALETLDAIGEQLPAGPTTVKVTVDVSRYGGPLVHPSWTESLMAAGWMSPVYPLNTYGGLTEHPSISDTAVEDGAVLAASAFARHLTEQAAAAGKNIDFTYAGQAIRPAGTEPVAHVKSATLGKQLAYAMKQSNNMLFEIFGREAALAAQHSPNFSGATDTTIDALRDLGIATDGLKFVDNSGLSPNSRATLHTTVELFNLMLTDETFRPLFETLTIAGYDGTMRYRMAEAPSSGIVHSKTGTLEVASSNAGLTVTADGRVLWFAINTTGADGQYAVARAEQDHLAEVLTECGCTSP